VIRVEFAGSFMKGGAENFDFQFNSIFLAQCQFLSIQLLAPRLSAKRRSAE
jgi:hypothetical protein